MLFDPAVFEVIWIATSCLALVVGLTVVVFVVVNGLAAVHVMRKAKPKERAAALAGYFRQDYDDQWPSHSELQETANQVSVGEPPLNFPLQAR